MVCLQILSGGVLVAAMDMFMPSSFRVQAGRNGAELTNISPGLSRILIQFIPNEKVVDLKVEDGFKKKWSPVTHSYGHLEGL